MQFAQTMPSLGDIGFALVDFAFSSALVASIASLVAFFSREGPGAGWARLGRVAFAAHASSVFATFFYLLGLIFARRYEFHYVYSHSSNELPNHFMLASIWEGQEGSFLIWMLWHAALGLLVLWKGPRRWRDGVLGIMATVQVILASMVLGIYVPEGFAQGIVLALAVGFSLWAWRNSLKTSGMAPPAAQPGATKHASTLLWMGWLVAGLVAANVWMGTTGFWHAKTADWPFALQSAYFAAFMAYLSYYLIKHQPRLLDYAPLLGLGGLATTLMLAELGAWKVGSSPFVLLKDAMPNDPAFAQNPDFVPANGTGLNPLLQNYWMVIHPPTLFLGFAATLVPFAYAVAGLIKKDYASWPKPAQPWSVFASMILGAGIIMGGYWAYETLNFGGYWNWDPVENASFVPWLTSVGALHALLSWRTGRANIRTAILLLLATFVLVLYSTFLTRSGILGNTSVHSFTDLGLSGQLMLLLMLYFGGVALLVAQRWPSLPTKAKAGKMWSREGVLFLASAVLAASATVIILATSIPVFNAVFGTSVAPPSAIAFFYYKWNVWFAIGLMALSGVGQFLYWLRVEKVDVGRALFRPFALSLGLTLAIMVLLTLADWQFVFNERFKTTLETVREQGNALDVALNFLGHAFLYVSDEILLAAGIFSILANLDVLVRLLRKSRRHLARMGGALAHIGFGLMLLGILFSSGYDSILSKNLRPAELAGGFTDQQAEDNVRLILNVPTQVPGYTVTFRGKNFPVAPIRDVGLITRETQLAVVGFRDADGERYAVVLPEEVFYKPGQARMAPAANPGARPPELDEDKLIAFVEKDWEHLGPTLMNRRSIYQIDFQSHETGKTFSVFPETEMNGQEGIIPHPDREIKLGEDIYVHVSSIPSESQFTSVVEGALLGMGARDTVRLGGGTFIVADTIVQVRDLPGGMPDSVILVRAKLRVNDGNREFRVNPQFLITPNQIIPSPATVDPIGLQLSISRIVLNEGPNHGKLELFVARRNDFVVFQAIRKPLINLLWLGTFLLTAGFGLAIYRRVTESRRGRD